jgi:hypothetical protein
MARTGDRSIINPAHSPADAVAEAGLLLQKAGAKLMTSNQYKLETALHALNVMILEQEIEFPEALSLTLKSFAVSRAKLIAAYDSQP